MKENTEDLYICPGAAEGTSDEPKKYGCSKGKKGFHCSHGTPHRKDLGCGMSLVGCIPVAPEGAGYG